MKTKAGMACRGRTKECRSRKGKTGKTAPNPLNRDLCAEKPDPKRTADVTEPGSTERFGQGIFAHLDCAASRQSRGTCRLRLTDSRSFRLPEQSETKCLSDFWGTASAGAILTGAWGGLPAASGAEG